MLRAAVDAGITFFDTSDLYSQGQSEILLGRALGARRSEVIIATKGGYVVPDERRLARPGQAVRAPARPAAPGPAVRTRQRRDRRPCPRTSRPPTWRPPSTPACGGCGPTTSTSTSSTAHRAPIVERGRLRRRRSSALKAARQDPPLRAGRRHAEDVSGFELHPGVASVQVPFSLLHPEAADLLFPGRRLTGVAIIARSCYAAGLFRDGLDQATLQAVTPDWPEILELHRRADAIGRPLMEAALQFSLAPRGGRGDDPGDANPSAPRGQPPQLRCVTTHAIRDRHLDGRSRGGP